MRLISLIFTLFLSLSALADNVLVVHQNYNNSGQNIGNRLIAAGHTVTYTTSDPPNLNGYQQVWDVRYSVAVSGTLATMYDTFLKNNGFLYLTTENPGCCAVRNNSVATFISNAGGGATTIGGAAGSTSNTLNVMNTTYMTAGNVVTFAAGSNIQNAQGTWLFKDTSDKVGGMMWIGNAGDLGAGYNGTILVVSDINWTDNTYYNQGNLVALDDMIDGFVAATVQGTISETGNTGGGVATPVYGNYSITSNQNNLRTSRLASNPNGHNSQISIIGDDNVVAIQQIGTSGHYANVNVGGNVNTIDILQTSNVNGRHYTDVNVSGGSNSLTLQQRDTSKTQIVNVNGNSNTVATNQLGTGNHFLDLSVTGNSHNASVTQNGAGHHNARVILDGTQPWNFQLNQNSSTGQNYNLPHNMSDGSPVSGTCSTVGGCNLIINQQ